MLTKSMSLFSLLLLAKGIWGTGTVFQFETYKTLGNFLSVVLPLVSTPPQDNVFVLAQLNTVETWLALENCSGLTCEAVEPTYVPTQPFLSYFQCPAHYQCNTVGYGKPTMQIWKPVTNTASDTTHVILAADSLNRLYPTEQPNPVNPNNPPAAGVMGFGPICCSSPLIDDYDIGNQSASILQALFKSRYTAPEGGPTQGFAFVRGISAWGTLFGTMSYFIQTSEKDLIDVDLIPILPGSCCWKFQISSAVTVYNSIAVDVTKVLKRIKKPETITYDAAMDFNMVSQEMAEAYATAFNNLNTNFHAVREDQGKYIAYRYAFVPRVAPVFPALSFNAVTADGTDKVFDFVGQQGVTILGPGQNNAVYLPFAYYKCAPCLDDWILGYPAINDGFKPDPDLSNEYPIMVTKGSPEGIKEYFIALKDTN